MNMTFFRNDKPLLTVMLICETPEAIIGRVRNALCDGAEAFCMQTEYLKREYHTPEVFEKLFAEMKDAPCYATAYRGRHNAGLTDEELAQDLAMLARCGASLCDIPGDMFCKHPEQMTDDQDAIQKQMELIDQIHREGAQVLMSAHVLKYIPEERVLELALEQQRRGADVVKLVTGAETMEQQLDNLRITQLLKQKLYVPYLFLSGGKSTFHRRLGIHLGCCMALCTYEHDALSSTAQPLLRIMKPIRDDLGF